MAALASIPWMDQPWTQAWLSFNLSPARWVHPAWRSRLLPEAIARLLEERASSDAASQLMRHWSGAMLRTPEMAPVETVDDPALPLALLDGTTLARLVRRCGLAVLAPSICRVITRDDVALLAAELGEDDLRFARQVAPAIRPGGAVQAGFPVPSAVAVADATRLGLAILSLVFEQAAPPVRARARLRLPPGTDQAAPELPSDLADGATALRLARQVLLEIDPEWLSSFPTPR